MNISGVYKIQSKIKPERIYIGSAVDIKIRWQQHKNALKSNYHHSLKLQRHSDKYGLADLQFLILLGCDKRDLIRNEQYFIDSYNPYFNTCKIAGSVLGTKQSDATKEKRSRSMRGRSTWWSKGVPAWNKNKKQPEEVKEKISKANKGKIAWNKGLHHSEETRQKLSIARRRRGPHSIETRKKMSLSNMGKHNRVASEETRAKLSKSHMGHVPWNKGKKTGVISFTSFKKGHIPWNKELKKIA